MQFRKKPVVIEAITFGQLVAHGHTVKGTNIVNGMPWSFTYNGHPITHETDECYLIPTSEGTMKMGPTDMLITGVQGEIYPCKVDIFEATYRPVGAAMNFGDALEALRAGKRVAREGWNGKGMWLALSPGAKALPAEKFWAQQNRRHAEKHGPTDVLPCITMKTATGEILIGWLASQTDMLSDDWCVVP